MQAAGQHGESPIERTEQEGLPHRRLLIALRLGYMLLLITGALLPFVGSVTNAADFPFTDFAPAVIVTVLFGMLVLILDAATPNRKLAGVFGLYLGVIAGLIAALTIGAVIDLIADSWSLGDSPWIGKRGLVKLALGITICYLAVSTVLTTKDDFRLVIPYVEFAKQVRGVRPLLIDTSALIDGRIDAFGQSGFLDAPLVVPQFVLNELQSLADSSDRLKRARGRRGLDLVRALQANAIVDVTIDSAAPPGHSVDHLLLRMAAERKMRILTTDYNLNKVAQIQGVTVLNLNDLAMTLRPQVLPGERLEVEIVKRGEAAGQGVGYLPDGTMVVVEGASDRIGETVALEVTNSLQTSAGRLVFGRPPGLDEADAARTESIAEAALHQPRSADAGSRSADAGSRAAGAGPRRGERPSPRNPRR